MNLRGKGNWLLAAAMAGAIGFAAQAPQQPPPQKPPEKQEPKKETKKPRRVWTNDDVGGLRKPWDEHEEKKAAEKAAAEKVAAQAKGAEEKKEEPEEVDPLSIDPATGKPFLDPDSPEGIQKQIEGWEKSLVAAHEAVEEARKERNAAASQSDWDSWNDRLQIREQNVRELQELIAGLKVKLEEAKKGAPPAQPSGDAGAPPAKQPPPPPKKPGQP